MPMPPMGAPGAMPADNDETSGSDMPETDSGAAEGGGSYGGDAGNHPGEPDKDCATLLWKRVVALKPNDIQILESGLTKPMALVLLKIVPELQTLILQAPSMSGPDMQGVRDAFNHDDVMAHLASKIGGNGGAPAAPAPTQPASPPLPGAPSGPMARPQSALANIG